MPTVHINLDPQTFQALAGLAMMEQRPIPWQAERLLRLAVQKTDDAGKTPVTPGEVGHGEHEVA